MVFITLVIGPAGVGKSSMVGKMQEHGSVSKRVICVGNLDPACDYVPYEADLDIRELITVEDAMTELNFGPNGALIYCMEYLDSHMIWLEEKLNEFGAEDTLMLDCPGQLELYTHVPVMPRICEALQRWGHHLCCAYLMDATALADANKFVAGSLAGLAAMLQLPVPRLTVLSKSDLVSEQSLEAFLDMGSASVFLERHDHLDRAHRRQHQPQPATMRLPRANKTSTSFSKLQYAISNIVDDHAMLSFVPLSIRDEDSAGHVLGLIDHLTQYYDHAEVRIPDDDYPMDDDSETPYALTQAAEELFGSGPAEKYH